MIHPLLDWLRHVFRPDLLHPLCSCAKAWCQAQEGWRKSPQSRGACWPRDGWSSSSTTEPSCWLSAPVSFAPCRLRVTDASQHELKHFSPCFSTASLNHPCRDASNVTCCEMPWPESSSDVIETCLFVLWRHLEYYLLHCTPSDPKDSLLPGGSLYRSRLTDGERRRHVCMCIFNLGGPQ